ncbi:MAG TPA: MATE family efflux transporter [Devosia sp.]
MAEIAEAPVDGVRDPIAPQAARTWTGELKALFVLGWPLIIAQVAQNALHTTDIVLMGWLGPDALAAGAVASAVIICLQLLGVGLIGAVAPLVAQALGARQIKSVRRIVRQGLWVAILLAAIIIPIVWNLRPILLLLGQDADLAAMAEPYAHTVGWLMAPAFGIVVLRSFLSAHGATRVVLLISVAGVFVNGLVAYALIFGHWGFPRLGLAGAGVATTTVNVVMFALMLAYVLTHRKFRRYHILARFTKPDWPHFFEIFRIGTPIGLMLVAEVALFTSAALMQGWIGASSVAAHAVALQCASLAFMVPLGLSQATTVRVGLAFGERSPDGVRLAGWVSLGTTLLFMSTTCVLFLSAPHALVGLFLDASRPENAEALALAASFLMVAGIFQLVDGAQVSAGAALRGLSDTTVPLILALIGYWGVGFPVAYVFAFVVGLKGLGIWYGLAAGLAFAAIALTIRFAMRERLKLVPGTAERPE